MTINSANNLIINSDSRPRQTLPWPWLTRGQDPRPKCTLVLGDGFTQDFLQSQSLSNVIKSSVSYHFQSWPELRYYTTEGEMKLTDDDPNFWEMAKWPRLFERWSQANAQNAWDFYVQLSKERINPHREAGAWTVDSNSVAYELRCYLWHLFRSWDRAIERHINQRGGLASWAWLKLLHLLHSEFRLTVASFNYDLVFEKVHRMLQCRDQLSILCAGSHAEAEAVPANSVHLIKLHGGLGLSIEPSQEAFIGYRASPWLDDPFLVQRNMVFGHQFKFTDDLTKMPLIPELVPPGHQGDHLCCPVWPVTSLAKAYLAESEIVIFCGLSAREPDTMEVKDLVSAIPVASLVVQIGREDFDDQRNPLARLLAAHGSLVQFVDAKRLNDVFNTLAKASLLRNDWRSVFMD